MALVANATATLPPVMDGDDAFHRVDTHTPAHQLPPGTAAGASNKRFEAGKAHPRFNVNRQAWGKPGNGLLPKFNAMRWSSGTGGVGQNMAGDLFLQVTGFVVGNRYSFREGNGTQLSTDREDLGGGDWYPSGTEIKVNGVFKATSTSYWLWCEAGAASGKLISTRIVPVHKPRAFSRFNDPNGFDNLVLLTDEWRSGIGEDGGRGRAWRVIHSNAPQAIPLNGHSVWDTARLIPCFNGLTCIRHGNERHYFSALRTVAITDTNAAADTLSCDTANLATGDACEVSGITGASGRLFLRVESTGVISLYDTNAHAIDTEETDGLLDLTEDDETGTLSKYNVDPTAAQIQLNCTPNWEDGDIVSFVAMREFNSEIIGTSPPATNTRYFVKNIAGNKVELYREAGLSTKLTMETSALGRFYLERQAAEPGFYGNGAPPLLMQPNAGGNTAFEVGFETVSNNVAITDTTAGTDILDVPNHRLVPGDAVVLASGTIGGWASGTKYAHIISEHKIKLYDTQDNALAGGATGLVDLSSDDQTGTLKKLGASGMPMPPAREGIYSRNNRLILVSDKSNLAISDPMDPLHFTPMIAAVTANLGEADETRAVFPFGDDSILVLKEHSILALNNFSGGSAHWTLTEITRQYGCIAPLSVVQAGADVWAFSRSGVVSVAATLQNKLQGVAEPVSKPMQTYLNAVDWRYAEQIVAAEWNNRLFIAFPRKGQATSVAATGEKPFVKNNAVLVYNFLTRGWEGLWTGDTLEVYGWARHNMAGNERLCFVDYDGQVNFFGEGFTDADGAGIEDELLTRIYTGAGALTHGRKLWLEAQCVWDTWKPKLSVAARTPGVNESDNLLDDHEYNKTQYVVNGAESYEASGATAAEFNAPHREDYSPEASELLVAKVDLHQNMTERLRMRLHDWGVQLAIANTQGSCRVQSVMVGGVNRGGVASRET